MRQIFSLLVGLVAVVALGACGDDGGDGSGGSTCDGLDGAVVGSCLWSDGRCGEFRGGFTAATAEADCTGDDDPGVFSTLGCEASFTTSGGCVIERNGATGVMYAPQMTESQLEAQCDQEGGCYFGDGGNDGTGGTGGEECTEPEPGASLGGSCEFMGFCYEVRGGSTAEWRTACLDPQVGGVWSDGACAEAYKASGGCMTGMFGTTVTYYYGDLGASYVEAGCADTPCGEYVAP